MKKIEDDNASLLQTVMKKTGNNEAAAYFLLFTYAPEALPTPVKTLEEAKKTYPALNVRDKTLQSYLYREDLQKVAKYIMKRQEGKRDLELLNKAYNRAMTKGSPNDVKCYFEVKKHVFAGDDEKDELMEILSNADVSINNADIRDVEKGMF